MNNLERSGVEGSVSHGVSMGSRRSASIVSFFKVVGGETRALLAEMIHVLRNERAFFIALAVIFVVLTSLALRFDRPYDHWVKSIRDVEPGLRAAAHHIRRWGRGTDTTTFAGLLFIWAAVRRSRRWARAGLACALAAIVAGIAINIARVSLGRPRPRTEVRDRLTGPTLVYAYQSFPSGHTSASVAAGTSLLITAPALGTIAFLSAVSMGWASTFTRAHYLSDVTAGLGAGLWFGIALGWSARRLNRRAE